MYKARIKEKYIKEVVPKMKKEFNYKNDLAVPKITKVTVNTSVGSLLKDGNSDLKKISEDFASIVGQKPVTTKAKKAIAGFKIKKGAVVGLTATLRGVIMYEFLDRFVNVVLPQVRDFRGLKKKSFDKNGNYNIGIKEHIVFPEVVRDTIENIFGMEINIVTTAKTDKEAYKLLKYLGFPIIDDSKNNT
jgi:large subunit ribosomal protein L5